MLFHTQQMFWISCFRQPKNFNQYRQTKETKKNHLNLRGEFQYAFNWINQITRQSKILFAIIISLHNIHNNYCLTVLLKKQRVWHYCQHFKNCFVPTPTKWIEWGYPPVARCPLPVARVPSSFDGCRNHRESLFVIIINVLFFSSLLSWSFLLLKDFKGILESKQLPIKKFLATVRRANAYDRLVDSTEYTDGTIVI